MTNLVVKLAIYAALSYSAAASLCNPAYSQDGNGATSSDYGQIAQYRRAAKQAENKLDFPNEMNFLQKAGQLGDAHSMYNLGWIYFGANDAQGRHFQDYSKAVYWFQKAADLNYPPALTQLGVMYGSDGSFGVPSDQMKATQLFLRAAQMGDAQAMDNLGVRYMQGLGIAKDLDRAVYWWRRAAASGGSSGQAAQSWLDLFDNGHSQRNDKGVL